MNSPLIDEIRPPPSPFMYCMFHSVFYTWTIPNHFFKNFCVGWLPLLSLLKSIAKGSTDQDVACLNIIKLFCVFLQVAHFPRHSLQYQSCFLEFVLWYCLSAQQIISNSEAAMLWTLPFMSSNLQGGFGLVGLVYWVLFLRFGLVGFVSWVWFGRFGFIDTEW